MSTTNIKEALFYFLNNSPAITAFVGGAAQSPPTVPRIYPLVLRQDNMVLPILSYHMVYGDSEISLGGPVRKGYARIQISAWSNTRSESADIIETLRQLLRGYIGLWNDIYVTVVSFAYAPDMFDHISKIGHSSCQITVFFDEI